MNDKVLNRIFPGHIGHIKISSESNDFGLLNWSCSCEAGLQCTIYTYNVIYNEIANEDSFNEAFLPSPVVTLYDNVPITFTPNIGEEQMPSAIEAIQNLTAALEAGNYNAIPPLAQGQPLRMVNLPDIRWDAQPLTYTSYTRSGIRKASGERFKKKPELSKDEVQKVRTYRRTNNLCLKCGDKGSMINMACYCNSGHGRIFG